MARTEQAATSPARARVGLPVVPSGSRVQPLLLRLPEATEGTTSRCNNGCRECLTRPVADEASAWTTDVRGRHVVLRDREATLRRDLPRLVRELSARGPASIALLTNGRMLVYPAIAGELVRAGVGRFVVKLFGLDAASHDDHTRVPGSFEQALAGIRAARALGAEALVTYPLLLQRSTPEGVAAAKERAALARTLTEREPCEMPEPQVESHGGEYRFDLMQIRGDLTHPYWVKSFFPMGHVNTGPVCNIRCVYCNVHGGDDQRVFDAAYVESMIDAAARKMLAGDHVGVPTLDFIGGEPTLHPALSSLIRTARDRGFRQITICSNGVLLLRDGYLDDLIRSGLTGVRFSFHDHRPAVANELADIPGLGDRYVDVAKVLLSRTELKPHIYRIILAHTIDALDDYIRWVAEHNHTGQRVELVLGMPSMRGRLFENRHIYPPLDGLRDKIGRAIELAESLGIEALLHHSPGCLYPKEPERSACLHIDTIQVDALSGETRKMNFEGDARYGEACEGCSGRSEGCHGLPSAYFDADEAAAEAWLTPLTYRAARAAG